MPSFQNFDKIGPRIAISKIMKHEPLITNYIVKVITLILFNIPLFSETHGERFKKIVGIVPEIFDVFSFFHATIFHLEKED